MTAMTKRRPYHAPRLTTYGSVALLTQGARGSGADGGLITGKTKGRQGPK